MSKLITLSEYLTLLLLDLATETATFFSKSIIVGVWLGTQLSNLISHKLSLALKGLIFTSKHILIVLVGRLHIMLVFESLVQAVDGLLLSIEFAIIVLDHGVAFVLKALVLGLCLNKLSLELLKLFIALASERLREISPNRLSLGRLES